MQSDTPYDLIIIGAGPVGLLCGILAFESGLRFLIIEKQSGSHRHSRSIGIHPPSLEIIAQAGLLEEFITEGVRIERGHAYAGPQSPVGTLDFRLTSSPFQYILSIPQWKTERILETRLKTLAPDSVLRNHTFTGISRAYYPENRRAKTSNLFDEPVPATSGFYTVDPSEDENNYRSNLLHPGNKNRGGECEPVINVETTAENGSRQTFVSRLVLGCDGKQSPTRIQAGIHCRGAPYSNRYAMGDFPDNTDFSSDAVIFLSSKGLVESFPLPGGVRRWVAQQTMEQTITDTGRLTEVIRERCGIQPDSSDSQMFSEFGAERKLADTFWKNRVILAGDAAHVVSPIGGQGMNLGWMNAVSAISEIEKFLKGTSTLDEAGRNYTEEARKRAKSVIRRSEFNMFLGHRSPATAIRNRLVEFLLSSPLRKTMAKRFTMQGL